MKRLNLFSNPGSRLAPLLLVYLDILSVSSRLLGKLKKQGVVFMYLNLSPECVSLLEDFQDLVLEVTGKLYSFPDLILVLAKSVDFEKTEISLRSKNV